ncbi:MAG: hypothetical protein VST64_00240 [Nitrospirota bacterium]|nr:hypothetical protein [Nitrospirota bacterium]
MDQTNKKGRPDLVGSKAATEINKPKHSNETARKNQPGRRWGFEHEGVKDMIDFRVSNTWLDWYHQQGLTPRSSGQRRPQPASSEVGWEHELWERAAS